MSDFFKFNTSVYNYLKRVLNEKPQAAGMTIFAAVIEDAGDGCNLSLTTAMHGEHNFTSAQSTAVAFIHKLLCEMADYVKDGVPDEMLPSILLPILKDALDDHLEKNPVVRSKRGVRQQHA